MRDAIFTRACVVGGLSLLVGCTDAGESCEQPTLTVSATPMTIASGDAVTLSVEVENFMLVDPDLHHEGRESDDPEFRHGDEGHSYDGACEGHYHVYLDDLMTNPLAMAFEPELTITVEAEPGAHELIVRLNDNEHKIITPDITDSVSIEVQP